MNNQGVSKWHFVNSCSTEQTTGLWERQSLGIQQWPVLYLTLMGATLCHQERERGREGGGSCTAVVVNCKLTAMCGKIATSFAQSVLLLTGTIMCGKSKSGLCIWCLKRSVCYSRWRPVAQLWISPVSVWGYACFSFVSLWRYHIRLCPHYILLAIPGMLASIKHWYQVDVMWDFVTTLQTE